MKHSCLFIVAVALASPSFAQSVPPPFTIAGAVPTIPQWEAAWASKADVGTTSGGGIVQQGAKDSTAVPWLFDTASSGSNLLNALSSGVKTAGGAPAAQSIQTETFPLLHAVTTALAASLIAKSSQGYLYNYNCTAITGGSQGFCVAYNSATVPSAGALTGANVLDYCYFDTTPRGCSLARSPNSVTYSAGVVILVTSAASPYTYTTGVDTAAITADYQ